MIVLELEQLAILLLFVASLVGILVKRLKMPYTVGLVLVGLALAILTPRFEGLQELAIPELLSSDVIPHIILGLLVPPLVFEAAFHIQIRELLKELPLILLFAIPGVVITMFLVGGVIAWGTGMALATALVLGALLAATDPVAVIALFRSVGAPKRLSLLLEGESLFNDGTAVVVFNIMLAVAATGEFNLVEGLLEFLEVSLGGLAIGLVLGWIASQIINRVDDYLIEITLTIVAAYGSFLLAEEFHFAGVLAVVAAGLLMGNVGPRGMSAVTQSRLLDFWEYLAFLVNSIVFLVVGFVIDLNLVLENWAIILLAIGAVLVARAIVIYLFNSLISDVPVKMQHILYWGGLRGAVSLALVLSVTRADVGATLEVIQAMAFGVVLFTLLVQGTTMEYLMERLGLISKFK